MAMRMMHQLSISAQANPAKPVFSAQRGRSQNRQAHARRTDMRRDVPLPVRRKVIRGEGAHD